MVDGRPITIVVPVYGDLPSLIACLDGIERTVDLSRDQVLLVNDDGPEADVIEQAVLARVSGRPGFRYERNPRNLGFVGNCNRAALELDRSGNDLLLLNSDTVPQPGWIDELREVLAARGDHGIVCARSTNATIASLPHRMDDPSRERTLEHSLLVREAVVDALPRWSYPPVAMGFCFLVRRELIDEHGLFDEIFAPGYGEENDFCLRMRALGHRSVMAHRALVVHEGARSFLSPRRARLRAEHEKVLVRRHPDYPNLVREYLWAEIDAVDAFADVLRPNAKCSVLVADHRDSSWLFRTVADANRLGPVSVLASRRRARALRSALSGVEVVEHGIEDARVWRLGIAHPDVDHNARLRLAHAAAEIVERVPESAPALDLGDVRTRWDRSAKELRERGVPLPPRPSARRRIRAALERRAPHVIAVVRRVLGR